MRDNLLSSEHTLGRAKMADESQSDGVESSKAGAVCSHMDQDGFKESRP